MHPTNNAHQDDQLAEGESSEPPDEGSEPPDLQFPGEFKCPVLLFKPKFAGQSKVYSALDNSTGHRVAIKQIKVTSDADSRNLISLIRELRFLRKLEHESIVNFLDVKLTPSNILIVQELMDTDLDCVFDNCPGGLGGDHTRLFSFQLIRAVNFLHSARVIHRDINPSNIFVNVDTLMLKLGDFGSSRILDNRFGARCLSIPAFARYYHAPEVLSGKGIYGLSADIFSVGCVLYLMVFGTCPISYDGDSAAEVLDSWEQFYLTGLESIAAVGDCSLHALIVDCLQREGDLRPTARGIIQSAYFDSFSDGYVEQRSKIKFSIEQEVFDFDSLYTELEMAVKECKPDVELQKLQNPSIRSFADYSGSVATSTVSEHDARIAQTDFDFGIQIHDCSDKKDRMFYEDHAAESGSPFDPYKWHEKSKDFPSVPGSVCGAIGYGSDSGYQSDLSHWHPNPVSSLLRCSESPDASSDHDENKQMSGSRNESFGSFSSMISERDLELAEEANRHHFDRCVPHHSHISSHHHKGHSHHHHHHRKHKHQKHHRGGGLGPHPS